MKRMHRNKPVQSFRPITLVLLLLVMLKSINSFGQPMVSGNLGINVAGDLEFRRGGYGLSLGYLKNNFLLELEVMRHQHFFKDSDMVRYIKDPNIDMNTDAILYTFNLTYLIPLKHNSRLHPTISGGAGLYHSWFDATNYLNPSTNPQTPNLEYDTLDTKQNNIGFHAATGIMYELKNKYLRLRSELRYSYALANNDKTTGGYFEDFGFLRFSVGISWLFLEK